MTLDQDEELSPMPPPKPIRTEAALTHVLESCDNAKWVRYGDFVYQPSADPHIFDAIVYGSLVARPFAQSGQLHIWAMYVADCLGHKLADALNRKLAKIAIP